MMVKKSKTLKPGDRVSIVASSSPFNQQAFRKGVELVKSWGYRVIYKKHIFNKSKISPYLAGSDTRRARELIQALQDNSSKAILFARGGYGSLRLLPYLDKVKRLKHPKMVIGYSDLTAVLTYLQQRFGWVTFYGPVVAKDLHAKTSPATLRSLKGCLSQPLMAPISHKGLRVICKGRARGVLTGGCLSLIASMLGTPYELNTKGKILFLEDVNERPYRIDRMLTQLKLAGKFNQVRGLIFSLSGPNPNGHYESTLKDVLGGMKVPIVCNFPVGHTKVKHCLALGVRVELDAGKKRLSFLEGHAKG